jgi:hypothetical protein
MDVVFLVGCVVLVAAAGVLPHNALGRNAVQQVKGVSVLVFSRNAVVAGAGKDAAAGVEARLPVTDQAVAHVRAQEFLYGLVAGVW